MKNIYLKEQSDGSYLIECDDKELPIDVVNSVLQEVCRRLASSQTELKIARIVAFLFMLLFFLKGAF